MAKRPNGGSSSEGTAPLHFRLAPKISLKLRYFLLSPQNLRLCGDPPPLRVDLPCHTYTKYGKANRLDWRKNLLTGRSGRQRVPAGPPDRGRRAGAQLLLPGLCRIPCLRAPTPVQGAGHFNRPGAAEAGGSLRWRILEVLGARRAGILPPVRLVSPDISPKWGAPDPRTDRTWLRTHGQG